STDWTPTPSASSVGLRAIYHSCHGAGGALDTLLPVADNRPPDREESMRCVLALALSLPLAATASEGHWRPAQLHDLSSELRDLGLQVPLGQLADPTAKPLGAILDLGTCSGAFVSPDGLIATAYHCITEGLQFASHPGENLFERGFYATERGQ